MKFRLAISLFLVVSALVVYGQLKDYGFLLYDDQEYITENLHIQYGLTKESIHWAFTSFHANFWHPLTWLSHMLDWSLFGPHAGGHHMISLVIHIASAIALFMALSIMTGAVWLSGIVAALFALHPLRVESVAWAAERKDVLSGLFWMLTLLAYVYYVANRNWRRYLLVVGSFILGNMAKPMLITLPVVFLLLDYWPLRRVESALKQGKPKSASASRPREAFLSAYTPLVIEKIPLLGIAAVFSLLAFLAQNRGSAIGSLDQYPLLIRIGNALVSYVKYIIKTLWPIDLALFYPHPGLSLPFWQIAGAAAAICGISILLARMAAGRPYLLVGWLWYMITLLPVIGIIQVGDHAMADRYTYIPQIGLLIMLVWGAWSFLERTQSGRRVFFSIAAVAICVCIVTAHQQVRFWQNDEILFENTARVTGNSYLYNKMKGVTALKTGNDPRTALEHLKLALNDNPQDAQIYFNVGLAYGRLSMPENAILNYRQAIKMIPRYADAHHNLAFELGRLGIREEALKHYLEVLRVNPDSIETRFNLGVLLVEMNRLDEAIQQYQIVLRKTPDNFDARNNIGVALARQGRLAEAAAHFSEAVTLNPRDEDARRNLELARRRLQSR